VIPQSNLNAYVGCDVGHSFEEMDPYLNSLLKGVVDTQGSWKAWAAYPKFIESVIMLIIYIWNQFCLSLYLFHSYMAINWSCLLFQLSKIVRVVSLWERNSRQKIKFTIKWIFCINSQDWRTPSFPRNRTHTRFYCRKRKICLLRKICEEEFFCESCKFMIDFSNFLASFIFWTTDLTHLWLHCWQAKHSRW